MGFLFASRVLCLNDSKAPGKNGQSTKQPVKERSREVKIYIPKPLAMLANVREGTPATKRWHISSVALSRKRDGDSGPRLVGLVGDSGVGKTTAASDVVRSI